MAPLTYNEYHNQLARIYGIVDNISFTNSLDLNRCKFIIGRHNAFAPDDELGNDLYLQVQFDSFDNFAAGNTEKPQHCRKWRLSPFMTETEIVRTAWKAILAALEHEAGEKFRYKGYTIFSPHIPIDALQQAAMRDPDERAPS